MAMIFSMKSFYDPINLRRSLLIANITSISLYVLKFSLITLIQSSTALAVPIVSSKINSNIVLCQIRNLFRLDFLILCTKLMNMRIKRRKSFQGFHKKGFTSFLEYIFFSQKRSLILL